MTRRPPAIQQPVLGLITALAVVTAGRPQSVNAESAVSTAVNIEAVACYSDSCAHCGNGWTDLPNADDDAVLFKTAMLQSGSIYTLGKEYYNASVFTTDFYDPDATGNSSDADTYNFDPPGSAISYFSGHGASGPGDTYPGPSPQYCINPYGCLYPPSGSTTPGFCRRYPGDTYGTCSYTAYNRAVESGNCCGGTCSRTATYSTGSAKWGESNYSGTWAGAGSNGGTNLAVIVASFAERAGRPQEIFAAFAGMHAMATTWVHTGDVASINYRGYNFAYRYLVNPYGSYAYAWNDALNSNPTDGQTHCRNSAGTVVYGGTHGFNGCGAQNITSVGATQPYAYYRLTDNWYDLQQNNGCCSNGPKDATGASYFAWQMTCNWDCVTYPWYM